MVRRDRRPCASLAIPDEKVFDEPRAAELSAPTDGQGRRTTKKGKNARVELQASKLRDHRERFQITSDCESKLNYRMVHD